MIEKSTPSAFHRTDLSNQLISSHMKEVVIVGFNIEYCVLFTAISACDRGFKVHVIEDACGTTNDEITYEMENLDINDFIGSVMNWSNVIGVHYYNEYLKLNA